MSTSTGLCRADTYPTLPVLLGNRLMSGFEASSMVVSDAALHPNPTLAIGWHVGAADFPLPEIMRAMVDHVAKISQASRIIFCGPSAGGFAALSMAVHYPKGSVARFRP